MNDLQAGHPSPELKLILVPYQFSSTILRKLDTNRVCTNIFSNSCGVFGLPGIFNLLLSIIFWKRQYAIEAPASSLLVTLSKTARRFPVVVFAACLILLFRVIISD